MNDSSAAAARRTLARAIDDSSATRQVALLRGIREMLRCDQAEVVQHIADYVASQHPGLRILDFLVERAPGEIMPIAIALIGFLRAFISVRSPEGGAGYAWIARLSNERRAIQSLRDLNPNSWSELKFGVVPDISTVRALCASFAPRHLGKLIRRLHRQHKFYKVLRVVELIAYYNRYLEIFRSSHFEIAVTSNHSNPHGLAFNLAARKSGLPVMLIAHGMPVRPVARLSYELAIVHSEAARETYLDEGCCLQHVLVHGRRDVYSAMPQQLPQRLTVGVFLCKEVNEGRVAGLVRQLLADSAVSQVVVRPHPKNLWRGLRKWAAKHDQARLRLAASKSLLTDIRAVDLVLAGNSSVLVDVVTAGTPCAHVNDLDYGSPDLHRLVACGLIYPLRIGGDGLRRDFQAILAFYQRPGWRRLLRRFANVDQTQAEVLAQACSIIKELTTAAADPPPHEKNR